MIFAFFTACLIQTSTGAVECANSYTEMTSVVREGESCDVLAKQLQNISLDSILIAKPGYTSAFARSGCGTLTEVMEEAETAHLGYVDAGIESYLYEF